MTTQVRTLIGEQMVRPHSTEQLRENSMSTLDNPGKSPTDDASETINEAKDEISKVSDAGIDAAKGIAESRFEQGREATTEQLDTASDAMNEVAEKLEENDSPFASYASELSDQLSSFSNKLSTSSIDDLVGGARSLARDNPAAFMLGSMAIGLAASRFFKATGEQVSRQSTASSSRSGRQYDDQGGTRRHDYNPRGMRDAGVEHDSDNTLVDPVKTASTSRHEHVAGHSVHRTSEEA